MLRQYHDKEWGVPIHDDRLLYELLVLEGAQAGLSWTTILRKRPAYRAAFDGFEPRKVASYSEDDVARLLLDPGIVRNRRKVMSAIGNARALLNVQEESGSFDSYIWDFVGHRPISNSWESLSEIPSRSPESSRMSAELLRRGFTFVGPTICYALMQSAGMVNDHVMDCYRHDEVGKESR